MASFNLTNVFFVCLLAFIKNSDSATASEKSLTPAPQPEYFSIKGHKATFNHDGSTDELTLDKGQWKSVYSFNGESKSVNVQYKKDSANYSCAIRGNSYTYTPKDKGLFGKVRSQVGNGIEHVLFETKDKFEMATKVVYDENDPNNLVVTIHHVNGLVRKIQKSKSTSWEEKDLKDSFRDAPEQTVEIPNESKTTKSESQHRESANPPSSNVKQSNELPKETSTKINLNGTSTPSPKGKAERNTSAHKHPAMKLDQSKIRILAIDPNYPKNTFDCDFSNYKVDTSDPSMVTYKLNDPLKCAGVKYDGQDVWNHCISKSEDYPSCLHLLKDGPIVVEMSDDLIYFVVRRPNGRFESVSMGKLSFKGDEIKLMTSDARQNPVFLKENKFDSVAHGFFVEYRLHSDTKCEALKIKDEVPWTYIDTLYGEYPSSLYVFPNRIVAICGEKTFVRHFDLEKPDHRTMPYEILKPALAAFKFDNRNGYLFYDFDSKIKCAGVNYDGKEIWKHDASKPKAPFADAVLFAAKGNTAFVYSGQSVNIVRLFNKGWKTIFSGSPFQVYIDISAKFPNVVFDYEKEGEVHTYTAKGQYVFSGLKKTNGFFSSQEIWDSKYFAEFSNKVVYDKTDPNNLIVEVYQLDGLIKKFTKPKSGKTWEEIIPTGTETRLSQDKIEILTTC